MSEEFALRMAVGLQAMAQFSTTNFVFWYKISGTNLCQMRAAPHALHTAHPAAWPLLCERSLTADCVRGHPARERGRGEQVWLHIAVGSTLIPDAAWY